mmetsp:Transcript_55594/g.90041  ORF Transcript_55594/g.90041 Transcript_55594/m.90041 type:complete len:87 (-) Transcript_55594:100-360(-)
MSTFERAMSLICMCHVSHMNESRLKDGEWNHERGLPMQHAICADLPLHRTSPCQACTFTPYTQELNYSRSVASSGVVSGKMFVFLA